MRRLCEGRTCIVTGAGGGVGREHALLLAAAGANVVVNDIGGAVDGSGRSDGPAVAVVAEIVAAGGTAVANTDDVSTWDGAARLIEEAVGSFGRLDALVNNAGILRDRMLVNMDEEEWDAVMRVHLKGTFAPTRHAAAHWRDRMKAGDDVTARVINTTSSSGLYGNPGQSNYGAAKAGIAAFTVITAMELARYGVTVNAIAPVALTRMTERLGAARDVEPEALERLRSVMGPQWVAPIVCWLASVESSGVTGRVFEAAGTHLAVAEGWQRGPRADAVLDPEQVGPLALDLVGRARANADLDGAVVPA